MVSKPIQLQVETKEILDSLKIIPRESYDHVIKRLIKDSRELRSEDNVTNC